MRRWVAALAVVLGTVAFAVAGTIAPRTAITVGRRRSAEDAADDFPFAPPATPRPGAARGTRRPAADPGRARPVADARGDAAQCGRARRGRARRIHRGRVFFRACPGTSSPAACIARRARRASCQPCCCRMGTGTTGASTRPPSRTSGRRSSPAPNDSIGGRIRCRRGRAAGAMGVVVVPLRPRGLRRQRADSDAPSRTASPKAGRRTRPPRRGFSSRAEPSRGCRSIMGLQSWNATTRAGFPRQPARRRSVAHRRERRQRRRHADVHPRRARRSPGRRSFPMVMVGTTMQGGCTCENADYLRIGTGNVEIASLWAPRPLGMTTADDWTKTMPETGFPRDAEALDDARRDRQRRASSRCRSSRTTTTTSAAPRCTAG